MAGDSTHEALREIRALYALGPVGGMTDAQLVTRFLQQGEDAESAFAALVERHGPMVLGVCRRMLGEDGAEDAFQAVFLVLARRAGAIRGRDGLRAWLHGVAVRTAKEARRRNARRLAREGAAMDLIRARSDPDRPPSDALALLDEELGQLPERLRLPLILCELEGLSRQDAARRLGLPEGTLSSRLARGRALLRDRLSRRGVAVGAGALAILLPESSRAAVPPGLADATARLALAYTAGSVAAGAVPEAVASLADGVLRMILLARWKTSLIATASLVAAGLSAAWAASPRDDGKPAAPAPAKADAPAKPAEPYPIIVRGTVVDEVGRPVAGAEVRSWPTSCYESTGMTGPDGTFAVPAFSAGDSFMLLARDARGDRLGYFRRYPGVANRAEAEAPVRVVLKPGRDIVVRVVRPDGSPTVGASVAAAFVVDGTTDRDGRATLRVPVDAKISWVFALKSGLGFDFAEFGVSDPGRVDRGLTAAELPATIDLALGGARTVRILALDTAGRPVAGVRFCPSAIILDRRHSTALTAAIRIACATTDAEGVATFDWLPDEKNGIGFTSASEAFSTPRSALYDVTGAATMLTARLYRLGMIRGRVTKSGGTPAVGVRVVASGHGRGSDAAHGWDRTGEGGSYAIQVPSEVAYLVGVDDPEWAVPTREGIVLREGGPDAVADLKLERGTLIRGTVTVGPGRRPEPGQVIRIIERRGNVPADLESKTMPGPLQMSSRAQTGPDGTFAIRVARGTYDLYGPERSGRGETIEVGDQVELVRNFHRDRPDNGPIAIRVVLASDPGQCVAGATVETVASPDVRGMQFYATTDADGRFRGERRLAPMALRAASPDGTLAGVADVDADAKEVVIPIGPTASASGRALDAEGRPMANLPIDSDIERPRNFVHKIGHEATTDALGQFLVTGLVVGQRYRVTAATEPRRSVDLTTVVASHPEAIDLGELRVGASDSFRDDPRVGASAPPVRGTALDGKALAPDAFLGKYVLLAFWGTWCGACLDELPGLRAVQDAFGKDPRFAMVMMSVDGSIDAPRRFAAEEANGLPGLQAFVGPRVPGSVANDFGVRGVPAVILIGPDGRVIARGMRGAAIKKAVAEALRPAP